MNKKILIVEDDLDLDYLLKRVLELLRYDSIVATSGEQGLAMAAAQLPDLIILDIQLPEMSGLSVASQIRQNPKTQSTPILALTATASREVCLQNGCNDYIAKPFIPKELISSIEKLLSSS